MNVSTIQRDVADRYIAKIKSSSKYDVTEGWCSVKVYRVTDGKLVVELDWDEDTDVIMSVHQDWWPAWDENTKITFTPHPES